MLRVLRVASEGNLSEQEIAERLDMRANSIGSQLDVLERQGLLVSGKLMPADLKIYRVTSRGQDSLATGTLP